MHNRKKDKHIPVLLKEVLKGLKVKRGEKYIDATVGEAGHALEIVKKGGVVLAIDRDPEMLERAKKRMKSVCPEDRLSIIKALSRRTRPAPQQALRGSAQENLPPYTCVVGNFKNLTGIARRHGFRKPAGILFDLGVSSTQLEDPKKGLSFVKDGPLDMRLDPELQITAQDLVNDLSEGELYEVFVRNAQEELARPIARAIVSARRIKPIERTLELAELVERVGAKRRRRVKLHPATKVFLALRIEVNDEIDNLRHGLTQAIELLKANGRLLVISFHETEDRVVKQTFRKAVHQGKLAILTKKPSVPSALEVRENPMSRSAKLRIAKRL